MAEAACVGFVRTLVRQRYAPFLTACSATPCAGSQPNGAAVLTSHPGSITSTTPSARLPPDPVVSRIATPPTRACISATAKRLTKPVGQAPTLTPTAGKQGTVAVAATYFFASPAAQTAESADGVGAVCTFNTFITSKTVAAADMAVIAGLVAVKGRHETTV